MLRPIGLDGHRWSPDWPLAEWETNRPAGRRAVTRPAFGVAWAAARGYNVKRLVALILFMKELG